MTVVESKLKSGSLLLGAFAVSCQATNVAITPDYKEDGDSVEVLCGDILSADVVRTDKLTITSIQDFDDPDGFIAYTWDNDLTEVTFTWKPSGVTGPTFSGTVQVRALAVGGEVRKRLTSDAEWTITGPTVYSYPP